MFALIATLTGLAIVTQDQASLRASPRDSGVQQAVLSAGDTLEIRGEKIDHLQVYDHRRERAGYVRASQVRRLSLDANGAPGLLAVLRFVRDTPGSEALGIGYAAAYLKAAPAEAITAEPFDAVGGMAERLARRASARQATVGAATPLASQLEGVANYGVKFTSHERDAAIQLCYDGDAFRRVLAMPSATPTEKARAALAVTRDDCIDPQMRATDRVALDHWRADVLDRVSAAEFATLPDALKNRLRMRRAGVWSVLAFQASKGANAAHTRTAADRALSELATIDKLALGDDDQIDYNDAAIRVGASRWGAEPAPVTTIASSMTPSSPSSSTKPGANTLRVSTEAGQPGETCVLLLDASHTPTSPLARRCTYGTAWAASARVHANGRAVAVAVQPLAAWRELWVFRLQGHAWVIDVLPPAASGPELGYVEFAGWVGAGQQMLVARESRVDGRYQRNFELVSIDTLHTDKQQANPATLGQWFTKWQDPTWKRATVSLR